MTIFSSFSANFPLPYHTILAINCVHASWLSLRVRASDYHWWPSMVACNKIKMLIQVVFAAELMSSSSYFKILILP